MSVLRTKRSSLRDWRERAALAHNLLKGLDEAEGDAEYIDLPVQQKPKAALMHILAVR